MATKHIVSCQVAIDTAYGDIDSTTGLPKTTPTGTLYAAEITDRSTLVLPGDAVLTDVNSVSRNGLYQMPPEPTSLKDGADYIKRRTGTVSLTMPMRMVGGGTAYTDIKTMPLYAIANTALQTFSNAAAGTDVVATIGTTTSHTATSGAKFDVGNAFKVIIDGRVEYSCITDITGDVLKYSPALSTALTIAQVVYPMDELIIPHYGVPTTIPSVTLQLNGIGWQADCSGATVTSMSFNYSSETARLEVTFELDCAHINYQNVADSTVAVAYADGGVLHHLKSYLTISDTGGTRSVPVVAPAELAATQYCMDEFSLTLNFERSINGCGESMIGRSGFEITDYSAEGSIILGGTSTAFDDDLFSGTMRTFVIGFNSGDATDEGEGGCIVIPAAIITNDPEKRDVGKSHLRTALNFGVGYWTGDTDGTDPADSLFRLCFGADF